MGMRCMMRAWMWSRMRVWIRMRMRMVADLGVDDNADAMDWDANADPDKQALGQHRYVQPAVLSPPMTITTIISTINTPLVHRT